MSTKGQVTVFIIIGIVILAVFALVLYISNITTSEEFETEGRPVTDTVPQEFVVIQEYTETCLDSVAEQGILILGQQGGYLYPSSLGDYSITDPTNSDGINMDPVLVPYWHYNSLENGELAVTVASLQPALYDDDENYAGGAYMSIESQLSRFVEEEIEDCLNGYEVFVNQNFGIVYDSSDASVITRIWDGHVDFTMEMPVAVTREGAEQEMTTYFADLEVDLKHVYEIAAEITSAEQEYTFLENHVIELLNVHSRVDESGFPPFGAMDAGENPQPVTWTTTQLKVMLRGLLNSYIPVLRYYGSESFYQYTYQDDSLLTDLYQRVSDNMIIPLTGAEDLTVSFSYLDWEPYLDLNGGQEKIEPDGLFINSPFEVMPFQYGYMKYFNTYDVSYPVLVNLEDKSAFNGKGYTFNFALESNVVNNNPIDADKVQSPPSITISSPSLACDENQKGTEMITTIIVDAYTNDPLELVNIGLKIPGSDYCSIGETDSGGLLESKYPLLYGGELELSLDGYMKTNYLLDTYYFKDFGGIYGYAVEGLDYEILGIYPEKDVEINVKGVYAKKCLTPKVCISDSGDEDCDEDGTKMCFSNGNVSSSNMFMGQSVAEVLANGSISRTNEYYLPSSNIKDLKDYHQISLVLQRVSGLEGDYGMGEHTQFINLDGNTSQTVTLVPGSYQIDVSLMAYDEFIVPNDYRCHYDEVEDEGSCDNVTGFIMDSYSASVYSWNEENLYLEITPEDLYNSDQLEFYVLVYDPADVPIWATNEDEDIINALVMEDMAFFTTLANLAKESPYRELLEPEWSNSIEEVEEVVE
jgi:hypothetical protein